MPGLLKFGFTSDTCTKRAIQLFSTGVPEPFKIEKYACTTDAYALEKEIHRILACYRHRPDREFFNLDVDTAIAAIKIRIPDIVWIEGYEYDVKFESSTQTKHHEDNVITFNVIKAIAVTFNQFMAYHKWFPNKNDINSECNNKAEYDLYVNRPLGYIDQGINRYEEAVEKRCKYLKEDTIWIRNELADIEKRLRSMKRRFESVPSESSPCRCRKCERYRKIDTHE